MSVADKIRELRNAKAEINTAIIQRGGTIDTTDGFSKFASAIANIPQEVTPEEVTYDGTVDEEGLMTKLEWSGTDIELFKANGITWSKDQSDKYVVTDAETKESIGKDTRWLDSVTAMHVSNLKGYRRLIGTPELNADVFLVDTPGFFKGCENLTYVRSLSTTDHADVSDLFYDCKSLRETPTLDFGKVVTAIGTFYNCVSLKKINASGTMMLIQDATAMFMNCKVLRKVPDLFSYTPSLTKTTSMFNGCATIETAPVFDMRSVNNAVRMFAGCSSLKEIGGFNNYSPSTIEGMFDGCSSLKYIPDFNTYLATSLSTVFRDCSSLLELPNGITTDNVLDMTESFSGCASLYSIPTLFAGKYKKITGMLNGCVSLKNVGGFTNLGIAFSNDSTEDNPDYRLDLSECTNLSLESLINIFNNLYDIKTKGVSFQCIKMTEDQKTLMRSTEEGVACLEKANAYGWDYSKY